jgi:hypothetical protein
MKQILRCTPTNKMPFAGAPPALRMTAKTNKDESLPQGLKPIFVDACNVRAEARTYLKNKSNSRGKTNTEILRCAQDDAGRAAKGMTRMGL